ncbi:hypothetical protein MSAN_00908900 [Mycena sanguinolenta]|uniref:Uncharacterized protein n=1 Tax=Mycena sanguinolenta TaxID=230812 RepID=A0A8H6YYB7_9AGAR|nr:hypothetical protein MSAN_00908900 [Mycena sanguinolenta]
MPSIPEEIVPNVVSAALPTKTWVDVLLVTAILAAIYYMLPLRLANDLDVTMTETKTLYDNAHKMGLRSPTETEMDALRKEVYLLVNETRRNSDSWRAALYDFSRGRAFILHYHIHKVNGVKYDIATSINSRSYAPETS